MGNPPFGTPSAPQEAYRAASAVLHHSPLMLGVLLRLGQISSGIDPITSYSALTVTASGDLQQRGDDQCNLWYSRQ